VKIEDIAELYGIGTAGIKPEPIRSRSRSSCWEAPGSTISSITMTRFPEHLQGEVRLRYPDGGSGTRRPNTRTLSAPWPRRRSCCLQPRGGGGVVDFSVRSPRRRKIVAPVQRPLRPHRESSFWRARRETVRRSRARGQGAGREDLPVEPAGGADQELLADGPSWWTSALVTGQVNGLSVYDLGDFSFGKPSRITARATSQGRRRGYRARGQALGASTTGVLILSHYLAAPTRRTRPCRFGEPCLRTELWRGGRDSASAAELWRPVRHRRRPGPAGPCPYRFDQPDGRVPAHRRREREDRRLLRGVQGRGLTAARAW